MTAEHTPHDQNRTPRLVGWALLAGGLTFFVGGAMHPEEDPPDATLKEHLHAMYEDGNWYPGHGLLLVGTALIALALVALARSGALAQVRAAHTAAMAAAGASVLAVLAAFLHLVMASEGDRIAAGDTTPLTDANLVVESIAAPLFGLAVAWLAIVGSRTGTLGGRSAAVLAVLGGVPYAIAGGTFTFTDATDVLFPLAGFIGLWAVVTGVGVLRRSPAPNPSELPVAAEDIGAP
jgi:hypothetical protein